MLVVTLDPQMPVRATGQFGKTAQTLRAEEGPPAGAQAGRIFPSIPFHQVKRSVDHRSWEDGGNGPPGKASGGFDPRAPSAGRIREGGADHAPKGLIGPASADQAPWPCDVTAATRKR